MFIHPCFYYTIGRKMVSLLKPGLLKSTGVPQLNPPYTNSRANPPTTQLNPPHATTRVKPVTSMLTVGGKQIELTLSQHTPHMLTAKHSQRRKSVKSHIPASQRTCGICSRTFRHVSTLQLHMFYNHRTVLYYNRLLQRLQKWGVDCMLRGRLRNRATNEHDAGLNEQGTRQIVRCRSCGSQQRSPAALASHYHRIHSCIKCRVCNARFSNMLQYHSHVRIKHWDKFHR